MCVTLQGLPAPQGQHMETVDLAHEHKRAYAAGTWELSAWKGQGA